MNEGIEYFLLVGIPFLLFFCCCCPCRKLGSSGRKISNGGWHPPLFIAITRKLCGTQEKQIGTQEEQIEKVIESPHSIHPIV